MKPWLLPALWTGDVLSIVSVFHMFEIVLSKKTALWNCALACKLPQTIYAIFIHWKRPHTPEFNTNFIRFPWQTMTKQMFAAVISVSLSMKTKKHQNNGKKHKKKSMFVLQGKCKKKHKIKASSNSWNGRVTANQARAKMLPATLLSHWLPRPDLFIPVCIQHGSCAHSTVYKHSLILQNAAWIWTNPPCYKMFLGFLMVDQKPMWVTTKWLRKRVAVKNHDSLLNRSWKFHSKFLVYFPGPRS